MLYVIVHLAARVWAGIVNLLGLRAQPDHVVPSMKSRSSKIVHIDDDMADAWIRQHDRFREAIARATPRSAAKDAELDDEWLGPWIRQQQRAKDAIARATPRRVPMEDAELDDEWVGPWLRQQQRVRDAIAQAKRRDSAANPETR